MAYRKGESGNPNGRPKGIVDKRHALRELLEPHAQGLIAKLVELAKKGDNTALKLCIDRLMPPLRPKDETVQFPLSGNSLAELGQSVLTAMATGTLSPDQGSRILSALTGQAKLIELDSLERRLTALEFKLDDKS